MGLSCTISEIDSDFSRKLLNFPTPCILHPRWKGSPLNWVLALWVRKLEWWGYRADKEVWWYLQPSSYNAPMWQMNGHRATAKTVLMHSVLRYLSRIPFFAFRAFTLLVGWQDGNLLCKNSCVGMLLVRAGFSWGQACFGVTRWETVRIKNPRLAQSCTTCNEMINITRKPRAYSQT